MSTRAEPLRVTLEQERDRDAPLVAGVAADAPASWDPQRFATEQIYGLVRKIFLVPGPREARQVVFSAVDTDTDIGGLCLEVGHVLSEQVANSVCVVETDRAVSEFENGSGGKTSKPILHHGVSEGLRKSSRQLSSRLWLVPSEVFWGGHDEIGPADVLRGRLDRLRAQFDYCVIQAPAAGMYGTSAQLGRLSDGVILVLKAHSTRRLAAQRAQSNLRAAGARLLGTVLSERTFPIPERLYRRL
jgi:succinoglycan biosynthesis transport protein ExoP